MTPAHTQDGPQTYVQTMVYWLKEMDTAYLGTLGALHDLERFKK